MTPETECVVRTPVASHSVVLVPVGHSVTLACSGHPLVVAVTDQLALSCACDDVLTTVRLRRFSSAPPAAPRPPTRGTRSEEPADETPDDVVEVVWELTTPDPFVAHVIDYGAAALPSLGVTPGRWKVRAAVWGRAEAEELEEKMIEQDLTAYEAWESGAAGPGGHGALDAADQVDFREGPEVWALDLWPA